MIRLSGAAFPRWAATLGATALLVVAAPAQTANATVLTCGQTVTTSVVLSADLLNCPGDGLVVGAGGITVDLNGRTIDGVGLGAGIRNNGFAGVTLTNSAAAPGRVQQFDYGVRLNAGTAGNIVEKLTIQNNEFSGIELNSAHTNNQVRNNLIDRQSHRGITIIGGSGSNVITGNTLTANQGQGAYVQNSAGNRIEGNRITGSGGNALALEGSGTNSLLVNTLGTSGDAAVTLRLGSNNNLVQGNTSDRSADAGLIVADSTGNRVLSNTLRNAGDSGIVLQAAHHTTVTGNDVRGNTGGIELSSANNNLIQSNNASNTTGIGIQLGLSLNNELRRNDANNNGAQGIYVVGDAPAATGNRLIENTTSVNQSDGISVSKAAHTLRGNIARDNKGWGVSADPGNIDGGGNQAVLTDDGTYTLTLADHQGTGQLAVNTTDQTLVQRRALPF
ncbi:nitrous oxide reductase family maturation protein NosD, partial [Streptomyces sp. NPDC058953]|uniref:right-handed parallel beta-helix repeat-containing protein n=1 Tax=Streptomyces sp. NPDC058953 TaxID=3346676 RepID=UPI0036A5C51D